MNVKKFEEDLYKNAKEDYGLCPPPISAQDALGILKDHFLGEDWYITLPVSAEQGNSEIVRTILENYPDSLCKKFCKRFNIR